ncbi:MAG: hypothetical protein AAFX94_15785 [Myxococcota bacterium]
MSGFTAIAALLALPPPFPTTGPGARSYAFECQVTLSTLGKLKGNDSLVRLGKKFGLQQVTLDMERSGFDGEEHFRKLRHAADRFRASLTSKEGRLAPSPEDFRRLETRAAECREKLESFERHVARLTQWTETLRCHAAARSDEDRNRLQTKLDTLAQALGYSRSATAEALKAISGPCRESSLTGEP